MILQSGLKTVLRMEMKKHLGDNIKGDLDLFDVFDETGGLKNLSGVRAIEYIVRLPFILEAKKLQV